MPIGASDGPASFRMSHASPALYIRGAAAKGAGQVDRRRMTSSCAICISPMPHCERQLLKRSLQLAEPLQPMLLGGTAGAARSTSSQT